ncbi:unnamed protein product [Microthlaspi erraticum]|uniref:Uncharacterized protein n=1 Tax=Microthlaspi erraticum TaxID=1685480 RepID=A0A6D2HVN7_9BRAS|nr:unnamed protein product [Microthlaspi erraticum]
MLQLTPTHCVQRPRCAPKSSPDGVSQGHFNLTPHSRLVLALIPNYNALSALPGESPMPSLDAQAPLGPLASPLSGGRSCYIRDTLMTCLLALLGVGLLTYTRKPESYRPEIPGPV